MILKFLALSLQHVGLSLTFSGEISLFRSHKNSTQKSGFQVHSDNVTVSYGGRAPLGPGGGASLQHSRKTSYTLAKKVAYVAKLNVAFWLMYCDVAYMAT